MQVNLLTLGIEISYSHGVTHVNTRRTTRGGQRGFLARVVNRCVNRGALGDTRDQLPTCIRDLNLDLILKCIWGYIVLTELDSAT